MLLRRVSKLFDSRIISVQIRVRNGRIEGMYPINVHKRITIMDNVNSSRSLVENVFVQFISCMVLWLLEITTINSMRTRPIYISYSTRRWVYIGTVIEHNYNKPKLQTEYNIIRTIMFCLIFIKIYKVEEGRLSEVAVQIK